MGTFRCAVPFPDGWQTSGGLRLKGTLRRFEHGRQRLPEALAFLDGDHPPIQLMVTDLVMAGGDGVTLANEARTRLPGLRVLFMSGYTEHAVLDDLMQPGSSFMAKPFIGAELDAALRGLLGASGNTGRP